MDFETGIINDETYNLILASLAYETSISRKNQFNLVDFGMYGTDSDGNKHSSICFFLCLWGGFYFNLWSAENIWVDYKPADLKNMVACMNGINSNILDHSATDKEIKKIVELTKIYLIIEEVDFKRTYGNKNDLKIQLYLEHGHYYLIIDDFPKSIHQSTLDTAAEIYNIVGKICN